METGMIEPSLKPTPERVSGIENFFIEYAGNPIEFLTEIRDRYLYVHNSANEDENTEIALVLDDGRQILVYDFLVRGPNLEVQGLPDYVTLTGKQTLQVILGKTTRPANEEKSQIGFSYQR